MIVTLCTRRRVSLRRLFVRSSLSFFFFPLLVLSLFPLLICHSVLFLFNSPHASSSSFYSLFCVFFVCWLLFLVVCMMDAGTPCSWRVSLWWTWKKKKCVRKMENTTYSMTKEKDYFSSSVTQISLFYPSCECHLSISFYMLIEHKVNLDFWFEFNGLLIL